MAKIINVISDKNVPKWGNKKKYIAIHYLGVVGQNNKVEAGGYGAHYYIYWDGTIYQAAKHDAILWQVGTAGYYTQKHPEARNSNTIGIELCPKCDGNASNPSDPYWYFTTETQEACVQLVKKLMQDLGIPASHVLRHYDIVNKHCPAPYVNNNKYKTSWTWEEFKARISGSSGGSSTDGTGQMYRIRKSWADAGSQIGAYENLDNAKAACKAGYTVYDKDGKAVYSKAETWKATGTATCGGNGVYVRSGPGKSHDPLGQLNKGQRFEVDGNDSGEWVHVKVAGIGIGYMHKDYVVYDQPTASASSWKAIGTATCTGQGVNVRSGPGTSYKSLGQLGKGNRFEVDGQEKNGFIHIKVHLNGKDRIAWISSQYVKRD
ncbi:MAG TPA: amidase [Candidatus Limivivens intestinipullorum]|uniref:Amidase n=1 Tax=Candidatus Limivivens intestinipullorum TaxID=2840858 RepID=A0A9D1ES87_9FIRM|nr:amidase [Candidatus Limivivens intestinipullorum]